MMNQTVQRYWQTTKWGVQNPRKFYICAVAAAVWPGVNWKERLGYRYPNSPLARRCRDCIRLLLGLCILSSLELAGFKRWCEYQGEKKAIERYEQRKFIQDIMERSKIVPLDMFEQKGR